MLGLTFFYDRPKKETKTDTFLSLRTKSKTKLLNFVQNWSTYIYIYIYIYIHTHTQNLISAFNAKNKNFCYS